MSLTDLLFISDTHWRHYKMAMEFLREDGSRVRQFASLQQHDELMIQNWNNKVKPGNKIYHLGDVIFGNRLDASSVLNRLNGKKRLLPGNHDKLTFDLLRHFERVQLWRVFKEYNFVMTHVPIRKDQFPHGVEFNVHGHIHYQAIDDPAYVNICVEHTDYAPLHLDELLAIIAKR